MKFLSVTISFLLFSIIGVLIWFFYGSHFMPHPTAPLESPIPIFFANKKTEVLAASFWKPKENTISKNSNKPTLSASSAISYDLTTDTLLYEKNINKRLPLASITKIMTAVIALESESLTKEITITKNDLVGENSMGLSEGEILTLEELLYGLILPSGNDAAEAIARNSPYGRDNFIYLMNKKAEDLGLSNTHFTNPSGLEGDGSQYSSSYDLLVMTRYALQNPVFTKIVDTLDYHIPFSDHNKEYYLYNDTNLLTSYPGVKGVKTGFTDEAGLCLVTYLDYKNHKIIAVLLNSEDRRGEMKELLDYSLKSLGVTPPPHS